MLSAALGSWTWRRSDGARLMADGSGTIAAGGTPQSLFGGVKPGNGWAIYNDDATNDLWVSDTNVNPAPNAVGCIRVAANGGDYETPLGRFPLGPVWIYGAVTG